MSLKIAINGFGRMGRLALRAAWDWPDLEIVHINEIAGSPAEAAHLDTCADCRGQRAALQRLTDELTVAQASVVSPDAEARYLDMFAQTRSGRPSLLARAAAWVQAQLAFDSRAQTAAAGVRSGGTLAYRLLFAADQAEVELMVEPVQSRRRLMGELVDDRGEALAPALVELAAQDGSVRFEAETDGFGRFLFEDLTPGNFALVITPSRVGDIIQVDSLVIT